jgi:hypothetical protein
VVSRCLSATGIRFSVILCPPGTPAPLHGRPAGPQSGPRRDYRVSHIRAATGVGALCAPGTAVLFPDRGHYPAGACRFAAACPCTPPHIPSTRISLNEASTKGSHVFARPIFPRLWPPGWNGPPLGCSLGFTPRRPRARRRTPGQGQAIEHGPGTTSSTHIRRSPIQ